MCVCLQAVTSLIVESIAQAFTSATTSVSAGCTSDSFAYSSAEASAFATAFADASAGALAEVKNGVSEATAASFARAVEVSLGMICLFLWILGLPDVVWIGFAESCQGSDLQVCVRIIRV